jgi:S1-C subfamily serine protease
MATPNSLIELSDQLAGVVEIGGKAVVAVHGRPQIPSSGILWRDGVVVTTDHTLKRHEDLTVTLPGGANVAATLAGRDPGTDIAVLRIAENGAPAAKPAGEASIKTGNLVLALGRRGDNGIGERRACGQTSRRSIYQNG